MGLRSFAAAGRPKLKFSSDRLRRAEGSPWADRARPIRPRGRWSGSPIGAARCARAPAGPSAALSLPASRGSSSTQQHTKETRLGCGWVPRKPATIGGPVRWRTDLTRRFAPWDGAGYLRMSLRAPRPDPRLGAAVDPNVRESPCASKAKEWCGQEDSNLHDSRH